MEWNKDRAKERKRERGRPTFSLFPRAQLGLTQFEGGNWKKIPFPFSKQILTKNTSPRRKHNGSEWVWWTPCPTDLLSHTVAIVPVENKPLWPWIYSRILWPSKFIVWAKLQGDVLAWLLAYSLFRRKHAKWTLVFIWELLKTRRWVTEINEGTLLMSLLFLLAFDVPKCGLRPSWLVVARLGDRLSVSNAIFVLSASVHWEAWQLLRKDANQKTMDRPGNQPSGTHTRAHGKKMKGEFGPSPSRAWKLSWDC